MEESSNAELRCSIWDVSVVFPRPTFQKGSKRKNFVLSCCDFLKRSIGTFAGFSCFQKGKANKYKEKRDKKKDEAGTS
jgi:hypothetical protein